MRVTIDMDKCQGHGRCYGVSPDLFDSDDEGYAVLLGAGDDGTIPPEHEAAARLAADNCPEYAIEVHPD